MSKVAFETWNSPPNPWWNLELFTCWWRKNTSHFHILHMKFPLPITKVDHFLWGVSETVPTIRAYEVTLWEEESPPFFANKKIQVYSHPVIHCQPVIVDDFIYIFMDSTTCGIVADFDSRQTFLRPHMLNHHALSPIHSAPLAALIAALKETTSLPDSVCPEEICQEFIWNFEGYRVPAASC